MEKCTYCVQRINYAKIKAEKEDRKVQDGEIIPACAGRLPVASHHVRRYQRPEEPGFASGSARALNYSLLGELNTRPRTTYLADIRNPNPELRSGAGELDQWRNRSKLASR